MIFILKARNAAIKQTIRRTELLDLLQRDAKTLPLFVSRYGEVPPPLCGAVPAENNYISKAIHHLFFFIIEEIKGNNNIIV